MKRRNLKHCGTNSWDHLLRPSRACSISQEKHYHLILQSRLVSGMYGRCSNLSALLPRIRRFLFQFRDLCDRNFGNDNWSGHLPWGSEHHLSVTMFSDASQIIGSTLKVISMPLSPGLYVTLWSPFSLLSETQESMCGQTTWLSQKPGKMAVVGVF